MTKVDILQEFPLLSGLSEAELNKIADQVVEKHYNEGDNICHRGDKGTNLYLIKDGQVCVTLPLYRYDQELQTVSMLTKGMFFGELSFFDGKEYAAEVSAKGETTTLVLNREDYDNIIEDDPESGYEIQQKIILSLIGIIRKMNIRYSRNVFLDR
jgi:CRP-like cAMP-binding protein